MKKVCNYCGERPATVSILNPNDPPDVIENTFWDVCESCKKIISVQQDLSMAHFLKHMAEKSNDNVQKDIANRLLKTTEENYEKILRKG